MPFEARKVGDLEFEIFGLCILIADQTTTPIHLRLQLMPEKDKFSWGECRVGEAGENGMVRRPWGSHTKDLHALKGRSNEIDWVYRATFGEKEI